jgi:hypothetical protein
MSHPRALRTLVVLVAASPSIAQAFVRTETSTGDAVSWDRRCIPWHLNNRGTPDVSLDAARRAVQRSFSTWQNVDCSDLELTEQGLTNIEMVGFRPDLENVNVVLWREEGEWAHSSMIIGLTTVTYCERAEGSLCAYSGLVLDADIELNGEVFTFTTSQVLGRTRYDIRNTVTHEVGHFIGFDHSTDVQSTMFASAPPGETQKATLAVDDENALCETYPGVSPVPACETPAVVGDYIVDDPRPDIESSSGSDDTGCSVRPGRSGTGATSAVWAALFIGLCRRHRRSARGVGTTRG